MKIMPMMALLLSIILLSGCSDIFEAASAGSSYNKSSIVAGQQLLPVSSSESSESSESADSEAPAPPPESPSAASSSSASSKEPEKAPTEPASPSQSEANPKNHGSPEFSLSSNEVKAGSMLVLTGKNLPENADIPISCTATGTRGFFMNGNNGEALIAVSRSSQLGDYSVTVTCGGKDTTLAFKIVDPSFESQSFKMDESVTDSTVNNTAARDEYNKITAANMDLNTGDPHFPDLNGFVMPLVQEKFRISSSFGFTRIVNGKVSGRHEGVDFPAPRGTPVVAAGDGRVLYSGFMKMTGNTVIIEHGAGLKSWYHHMNSLDCATGDILNAGDPVGKVGTTGYSTGNHLHFGISVFDIYTDPFQFIPKPVS